MKRMWLGAACVFLAACSSVGMMKEGAVSDVIDQTWVLASLNEQDALINSRVTLNFEAEKNGKGRIFGSASCNNYFGGYKIEKGRFDAGQVGSTMMMCDEPLMKQEQSYLQSLAKSTQITVNGDQLRLVSEDGTASLVFYAETGRVSGKTVLAAGSAFKAGGSIRIELIDNSEADMRPVILGSQRINLEHDVQGPVEFDVAYAPHLVQNSRTYTLNVRVLDSNGRKVASNAQGTVMDLGAPSRNPLIITLKSER